MNISTDEFNFISLASSVGNDFRTSIWKHSSTIFNIQMESNIPQDLVALALQIQMLKANIEELTKQNQEMRQRVQ